MKILSLTGSRIVRALISLESACFILVSNSLLNLMFLQENDLFMLSQVHVLHEANSILTVTLWNLSLTEPTSIFIFLLLKRRLPLLLYSPIVYDATFCLGCDTLINGLVTAIHWNVIAQPFVCNSLCNIATTYTSVRRLINEESWSFLKSLIGTCEATTSTMFAFTYLGKLILVNRLLHIINELIIMCHSNILPCKSYTCSQFVLRTVHCVYRSWLLLMGYLQCCLTCDSERWASSC